MRKDEKVDRVYTLVISRNLSDDFSAELDNSNRNMVKISFQETITDDLLDRKMKVWNASADFSLMTVLCLTMGIFFMWLSTESSAYRYIFFVAVTQNT